jgi:hypothetical protein
MEREHFALAGLEPLFAYAEIQRNQVDNAFINPAVFAFHFRNVPIADKNGLGEFNLRHL